MYYYYRYDIHKQIYCSWKTDGIGNELFLNNKKTVSLFVNIVFSFIFMLYYYFNQLSLSKLN